jgi:sigma-B regulation protein RsbU (phosphoserine phosphatase)
MSTEHPVAERPADFFRNYNRLVGATYAAIVILTLGFFLHQIYQKRAEEIASILGHVERHGQLIEFVLRNTVDYLEASRITALDFYANTPASDLATPVARSRLFPQIRTTADGSRFHLDAIAEPDSTGNLTGDGRFEGRTPRFYRDVEMALELAQDFQAISLNLPNAVSSRFVGVERFSYVFPWQESGKERFASSDHDTPTWRTGTPEADPTRGKYWASVHYAGTDKGLLAPVGAPIYDGDSFRGVLSIETSLDYLNRLNGDFGYPLGTAMLVDANAQVLAHPKFFADALDVREVPEFAKALPPGLDKDAVLALPARTPSEMGGHIVIRYAFLNAPWSLVYILPSSELSWKLFAERGVGMLAVILSLTLLMLVTYHVTAREFIAPASKLVQHIAAESQFEAPPIPTVPSAWKPWFDRISVAFRESMQLIGIRQELDIAAKMQLAILPREWPQQPEFALWGTMRSAKEVGGDFYDHFPLPGGRIGIVCADVSGKGVPAALFGMVSKTLIRAICTRSDVSPGENVAIVNDILSQDNDSCVFVTTFYGVFDPQDGTLTYVNAGHPPPLLVHADGGSEFLPMTKGIALGVCDGMPFSQATIALAADDTLFIYTDGVTEAFNASEEEFTPDRLLPIFTALPPTDVVDGVRRIIAAVDAHANGAPQSDDITCVALRSNLPPGARSGSGAAKDSSGAAA